jgi:hypothetical protein
LLREECCIGRDHARSRAREPSIQPERDGGHSVAVSARVCVCGVGKTSESLFADQDQYAGEFVTIFNEFAGIMA